MAEGGANLDGWEISVIFVLFMCISCVWQVLIAMITFLNSLYGPDTKNIWLTRLKEEVLDVGVISLALIFVQPYIANICVSTAHDESTNPPPRTTPSSGAPGIPPSFATNSTGRHLMEIISALPPAARRALAGGSADPCPAGKRHLFPVDSISTAHYLLFFVALVHIVYSFFTFTLTLQRFSTWARWERHTRRMEMDGAERPALEVDAGAWALEGGATHKGLRQWPPRLLVDCWRGLMGGVDPVRYKVLRGLFQLRARAYDATSFSSHNLHYSMVCENAMQIDIENVVAHGWLQALIVAIFTLYTTKAYQIVWIGGISVVVQVVVMVKLQSVMATIQRIMTMEEHRSGTIYRVNTTSKAFQDLTFTSPSSIDDDELEGQGSGTDYRPRASHQGGGSSRWIQPNQGSWSHTIRSGEVVGPNAGGASPRALVTALSTERGSGGGSGGMPLNVRGDVLPPQPFGRMNRGSGPLAEAWQEDVMAADQQQPSLSSRSDWWIAADGIAGEGSYRPWLHRWKGEMQYNDPAPASDMFPGVGGQRAQGHGVCRWASRGFVGLPRGAVQAAVESVPLFRGMGGRGSAPAVLAGRYGRRLEVRHPPGPVAEAQDKDLGSRNGGGGGSSGPRGVARFRSNSAGRSSSDAVAAAGAIAGKAMGGMGGGGGSSGGRVNIVARGESDRNVKLRSRSMGPGSGSGNDGVRERAGLAADVERGGLGLFLAPGCTSGRANPLFDMENQDAGMPELIREQKNSGGVFASAAANAAVALAAVAEQPLEPAATAADDGSSGSGPGKKTATLPGRFGWFGGKAVDGVGEGQGDGATVMTLGRGGESLGTTPSQNFANPLFREGSMVCESLSKAAAATAAAATCMTVPLQIVDAQGQLTPPRPPLQISPALGLRGSPMMRRSASSASGVEPPTTSGGKLAGTKRVSEGLLNAESSAQCSTATPPPAQRDLEPEEAASAWRRSSYGIGGDGMLATSGSSVLLPAAAAERRRLLKANPLYLKQPHLPILDVPPPPSNTAVLPAMKPNMASPRTAAAAAGSTVLAAAEVIYGGPVTWVTGSPRATEAMLSPGAMVGGSGSGSTSLGVPASSGFEFATNPAVHARSNSAGAPDLLSRTAQALEPTVLMTPSALHGAAQHDTVEFGCQVSLTEEAEVPAPATAAKNRVPLEASCQTLPLPNLPQPPPPSMQSLEVTAVVGPDHPVQQASTVTPLAALFEPYNPEEEAEEKHGVGGGGGGDDVGGGEVDMEVVELKLQGLFWFGRPELLLWITAVSYLQNSLSVTLCLYYMLSYGTKSSILQESRRLLHVWLPLLTSNVALMLYIGWVVVPLYTLVTATCVRNPRALQEHIRRHKKAEEEEGGITGFVVEQCTRCFRHSHHAATRHHAHHGVSHGAEVNSLFLANLANQAGVVMAAEGQRSAARLGSTGRVFQEFLVIWLARVRTQSGLEAPAGGEGFKMKADVTEFRAAFRAMDGDCSGRVTAEELSTHLLLLAGTRASKTELKAMITEIDSNGDNQISFMEFLVFMVFCFLDANGNGCVEMHDVIRACQRVKMNLSISDVEAMVALADPDGDGKIGLRQFYTLFKDVEMPGLEAHTTTAAATATTTATAPLGKPREPPAGQQQIAWDGRGGGDCRAGVSGSGGSATGRGGPGSSIATAGAAGGRGPAAAAAAAAQTSGGGCVSVFGLSGGRRDAPPATSDSRSISSVVQSARVEVYKGLRVKIPPSPAQM